MRFIDNALAEPESYTIDCKHQKGFDDGTFVRLQKGNKQLTAKEINDLSFARGAIVIRAAGRDVKKGRCWWPPQAVFYGKNGGLR
jgi:hypothetical protein